MSSGIRSKFYKSKTWQKTAHDYAASVNFLCEKCLAEGKIVPGAIVHHKVHLTDENLMDPEIALDFDNLEYLCRDCHAREHSAAKEKRARTKRWEIAEDGSVTLVDNKHTPL